MKSINNAPNMRMRWAWKPSSMWAASYRLSSSMPMPKTCPRPPKPLRMVRSKRQKAALAEAVWAAREMNRLYPYPASLIVAEWAVFSRWGADQPGRNPFRLAREEPGDSEQQPLVLEVFQDLSKAFLKHAVRQVRNPRFNLQYFEYFDNQIDVDELARRVFKSPQLVKKLISIMHAPYVEAA